MSRRAFLQTRLWWAHQGSNLGPTGYEPVALTTELWARCILWRLFLRQQMHYVQPVADGPLPHFRFYHSLQRRATRSCLAV